MKTKKAVLVSALLLLALVPGIPAKSGSEKGNKKILYQLLWNADNISGKIFINGFAIQEFDQPQSSGTATLNIWLMGDNEIRAEVKKADPARPSKITVGMSEMADGDIVSTTDQGTMFSIEKNDSDFSGSNNVIIAKTFKSQYNFSARLKGAGAVDEKQLIAYAKKIHGLFIKKDAGAILKEFSVKLKDYEEAFPIENAQAEFKQALVEGIFKDKLGKINPARLKAVRVNKDWNLWRLVDGDKDLIRTSYPDGSTSQMPIYAGIVDGALKVVR